MASAAASPATMTAPRDDRMTDNFRQQRTPNESRCDITIPNIAKLRQFAHPRPRLFVTRLPRPARSLSFFCPNSAFPPFTFTYINVHGTSVGATAPPPCSILNCNCEWIGTQTLYASDALASALSHSCRAPRLSQVSQHTDTHTAHMGSGRPNLSSQPPAPPLALDSGLAVLSAGRSPP